MGCTPIAPGPRTLPAVNAQPSKPHLKSITSIEDIIKLEQQEPPVSLDLLDLTMKEECQQTLGVPRLDFESKEVGAQR